MVQRRLRTLRRVRRQVCLILDRNRPSSFALELMNNAYEITHFGRGSEDENYCLDCRSGTLDLKQPGFGGCSNFPYCEFVAPKFGVRETGILIATKVASDDENYCTTQDCSGSAPTCLKCGVRSLITKHLSKMFLPPLGGEHGGGTPRSALLLTYRWVHDFCPTPVLICGSYSCSPTPVREAQTAPVQQFREPPPVGKDLPCSQ